MTGEVKILIVEDESTEALAIKKTLKSFNYKVPYIASNGKEAIKKAKELKPDLILMDIILKGELNGIDAASKIKEYDIPVIYLTDHSKDFTIEKAKLTEPYGYILKPYDPNELSYAIELAISKHESEKALKNSEKKYRRIIENIQDAHFQANKDGKLIMVSPSAAKMYRYDSTDEMIGMPAKNLYKNPIERQEMLKELEKKGKVENLQLLGVKKDGTIFWTLLNAQYFYDDQGQILGTEGFVRDINDLKKEENKYKALFENTGTATVILEENNIISIVNKKFEKLSGFTKEELEGKKKWTDFVTTEDLDKMKKYHHLRRQDPQAAPNIYDFNFVDRKGQLKKIHLDVDVIPGTKKSVASLLDITERKKVEDELRRSNEWLSFTQKASKSGFWDWDITTDKLTWSNEFFELFGLPLETEPSLDIWIKMLHPDDRETAMEKINQAIKDHQFLINEYRVILPNKDEIWIRALGTTYYDDDKPIRMGGICIDITKTKEVEKSLKESRKHYKNLYSSMNEGLSIHRVVYGKDHIPIDYEFLNVNPAFEEITGIKKDEIIRKTATETYQTDKPPYLDIYSEVADTGKPIQFETYYEPMNKHFKINVFSPSKGLFATVFEDITERKNIEDKLIKSETEYRAIFENTGTATAIIKDNMVLSLVNDEFTRLTGYEKDEIENKMRWTEFFIEDELPRMIEYHHLRRINPKAAPPNYETHLIDHDGKVKDVLLNATIIPGTKKSMFSLLDITEKKRSRIKLIRELKINQSLAKIYAPLISLDTSIKEISIPVLNESLTLTGSEHGFVATIDPKNGDMINHTLTEMMPGKCQVHKYEKLEEIRFPRGADGLYSGLWGHCLNTKKSFYTNKPQKHPSSKGSPKGHIKLVNFLSVPVILAEEAVGQIALANSEKGYSEENLKAVERIAEFFALAIQRKQAEEQIKNSLEEKEILLREIHHRVKNNLQIIASLLHLQEVVAEEERVVDVLLESESRIRSMAMIHEKLYQSPSFNEINFKQYLQKLISNIKTTFATDTRKIKVHLDVEDIKLNIDTSIPLGLLINELLTNSVKHAFPSERIGNIYVSLTKKDDNYLLIVKDDGIGIKEDLDISNIGSLGLQLVHYLTNQLEGEIRLDRSFGTEFRIKFKELEYKKRI